MKNPITPIEKDGDIYTQCLIIPNKLGLHARPATVLSKMVKKIGVPVFIETEDKKRADAKKMFEILELGLEYGSKITIFSEYEEAVEIVSEAFCEGLGDDLTQENVKSDNSVKVDQDTNNKKKLWEPKGDIKKIEGVAASDGLVIGKIHHYRQQHFKFTEEVGTVSEEINNLNNAIEKAKLFITDMKEEAASSINDDQKAIFDAHLSIVDDSDMLDDTLELIKKGENAAKAYKIVSDERISALSKVDNADIAARATDIRDVRNHVINALLGNSNDKQEFKEPVILCAEDLTPSDTVRLDPDKILAFVTTLGGPTSHSAIIARGMGMPAVVAVGQEIRNVEQETTLIVDGNNGYIYLDPDKEQLNSVQKAILEQKEQKQKDNARRLEKGQTSDGVNIEIAANINAADAVDNAVRSGAEGVGLMRTEFLYMERDSIPDEDTQEKAYRDMAESLNGAPLIIRTLDIGGDKEVPYLGLAHEDNSFLGIRGIRLCLERPDLFTPQLRAICRVAKDFSNIRVMFPMIGKLSDWQRAKARLDEIRKEVGAPEFSVGMMIEIPSAALIAPVLAEHVDFFSVGTNDLTQYTLAMDRMHPLLAGQADALHPAVLRLIKMTVDAAEKAGKWVGVCGGAAGEIDAAKILVGLGVTELSMAPPQIAGVKAALRHKSLQELKELANKMLMLDGSREVREFLKNQ